MDSPLRGRRGRRELHGAGTQSASREGLPCARVAGASPTPQKQRCRERRLRPAVQLPVVQPARLWSSSRDASFQRRAPLLPSSGETAVCMGRAALSAARERSGVQAATAAPAGRCEGPRTRSGRAATGGCLSAKAMPVTAGISGVVTRDAVARARNSPLAWRSSARRSGREARLGARRRARAKRAGRRRPGDSPGAPVKQGHR
jgi:hypothetical protein